MNIIPNVINLPRDVGLPINLIIKLFLANDIDKNYKLDANITISKGSTDTKNLAGCIEQSLPTQNNLKISRKRSTPGLSWAHSGLISSVFFLSIGSTLFMSNLKKLTVKKDKYFKIL